MKSVLGFCLHQSCPAGIADAVFAFPQGRLAPVLQAQIFPPMQRTTVLRITQPGSICCSPNACTACGTNAAGNGRSAGSFSWQAAPACAGLAAKTPSTSKTRQTRQTRKTRTAEIPVPRYAGMETAQPSPFRANTKKSAKLVSSGRSGRKG
jgi:hypothetical protein